MRSLTAAVAAALVLLPAAPAWAADQAPVAMDDAVDIRSVAGVDFLVDALANDSDPDGDPLTYTAVTPASKGITSIQGGRLFYRPILGNSGPDSFTYTVSDGQGNTATATVATTLWADPGVPGDAALSIPSPGSATLTWTAAEGAVEYRIHRGDGSLVHSTTELSWTATGLLDTENYQWSVLAVNGGGWTGGGSYLLHRSAMLPAPRALFVGGTDDATSLRLTWDGGGMAGPWRVYRDGTPVGTSPWAGYEDTGLVSGREYSYQVQLVGSSTPTMAWLPSALTTAVQGTPGVLSPIGQLFRDLGSETGILGPVTVAERAIPGGRMVDHRNGFIFQQDGEIPWPVTYPLASAYISAGGAMGDLGFPVGAQESGLRDGGFGQFFEGGSIWGSSATPTRVVRQVIEDGWAESGWEEGPLGYPVGEQRVVRGGAGQAFEDGGVYWTAASGSHGVSGPVHDRWLAAGAENGQLGLPVAGEVCGPVGCSQQFQGGSVHWSPALGAHPVWGGIHHTWTASGGPDGGLGYPATGEICGLRDRGCYQLFQGGSIYWSPATGGQVVLGSIRDTWARQGAEAGGLGYPTTGERCGLRDRGCYQLFQGGSIYWSPATGARVVLGSIGDTWARQGWEAGRLGYPTTSEICGLRDRGCHQLFQGGSIYWSPATGAHVVLGAIRETWGFAGSQGGRLGYPTTSEICGLRGGGCFQVFQGGSIYWSPASGAHVVLGSIRDSWARQGWEAGRLGYPLTGEICALRGGGCYQLFQGGSVYWSPASGAHPVVGGIRDTWARQGWEAGRLGYPIGSEWFSGGAYRQNFQGGTISLASGRPQIAYR